VQQRPELFGPGRIERGPDGMRTGGAFAQTGQARGVEGPNGVAHRLVVAAPLVGDRGWALTAGTRQQDLAATQDKRIGRAQPRLQSLALGSCQ